MEDKLNLYNEMGGDNLVGFLIILIAGSFTVYSAVATKCLDQMMIQYLKIRETVEKFVTQMADNRRKNCPPSPCQPPQYSLRSPITCSPTPSAPPTSPSPSPQPTRPRSPRRIPVSLNRNTANNCGPGGDDTDRLLNLQCTCEHVPVNRKTHNKRVRINSR
jgi:hypothetical protein